METACRADLKAVGEGGEGVRCWLEESLQWWKPSSEVPHRGLQNRAQMRAAA